MIRCQRCDWSTDDREQVAGHVLDAGHPACVVCQRRFLRDDETQTCSTCIARVRDDLDAVVVAFAHLDRVLGEAAYHGIAWSPLTLAADGAAAGGGEDDHVRYHDPVPPVAILEMHDRDWREEFGHPRPGYRPLGHPDRQLRHVLAECVVYLRTWHSLAARTHPGFDDYATEIAGLRSRLEHTVSLADDPLRAPATCFDCDGLLVRTYELPADPTPAGVHDCPQCGRRHAGRHGTDREGLTDDWTCQRCRRVYDQGSYFLALRAHRDACEGWVPVKLAADVLRRPVRTVWDWTWSGEVSSACDLTSRHVVVDWAEVAEMAAAKQRRLHERRAS